MSTSNRRRLAEIADELAMRQAKRSLRFFSEWVWPILEPETPYLPNWHIELICEYLEAVTAGEVHDWSSTFRLGT
jgi:hypothetical protein